MEAEFKRSNERECTISALNAAIEAMNLAKELSIITPAKAIFGSASVTLAVPISACLLFFFFVG